LALLTKSLVFLALLAAPAFAGSLAVGDRLDRLDVVDRSGTPVAGRDLEDKVVVLDFWASWCTPCRPMLGALESLARRYGEAGVVVLAVSADDDRDDAEEFLDEHFRGSAIRFVYDPGHRLLASIGADGLPAVYLLDRARVVRFAGSGYSAAELASIEREVNELLGRERHRLDGADLTSR
jgi:thiol-disulfide isomerase/thioredoxin